MWYDRAKHEFQLKNYHKCKQILECNLIKNQKQHSDERVWNLLSHVYDELNLFYQKKEPQSPSKDQKFKLLKCSMILLEDLKIKRSKNDKEEGERRDNQLQQDVKINQLISLAKRLIKDIGDERQRVQLLSLESYFKRDQLHDEPLRFIEWAKNELFDQGNVLDTTIEILETFSQLQHHNSVITHFYQYTSWFTCNIRWWKWGYSYCEQLLKSIEDKKEKNPSIFSVEINSTVQIENFLMMRLWCIERITSLTFKFNNAEELDRLFTQLNLCLIKSNRWESESEEWKEFIERFKLLCTLYSIEIQNLEYPEYRIEKLTSFTDNWNRMNKFAKETESLDTQFIFRMACSGVLRRFFSICDSEQKQTCFNFIFDFEKKLIKKLPSKYTSLPFIVDLLQWYTNSKWIQSISETSGGKCVETIVSIIFPDFANSSNLIMSMKQLNDPSIKDIMVFLHRIFYRMQTSELDQLLSVSEFTFWNTLLFFHNTKQSQNIPHGLYRIEVVRKYLLELREIPLLSVELLYYIGLHLSETNPSDAVNYLLSAIKKDLTEGEEKQKAIDKLIELSTYFLQLKQNQQALKCVDIPHPRTQLKKASILSLQLLTNKNDIKDLIDNIKQASHMLTPKEIDELREIEESLDLVHSTSPIRKMKKSKEKEENKEAKEEYVDEHKEEQDEDKKNDAEIKENKTVSRRDMFLQLLEKSSSQNLFESIKKNLEEDKGKVKSNKIENRPQSVETEEESSEESILENFNATRNKLSNLSTKGTDEKFESSDEETKLSDEIEKYEDKFDVRNTIAQGSPFGNPVLDD